MDIRSIIDSDSPASAHGRPVKQGHQQPERKLQGAFEVPPMNRNAYGGTRPPQPPPLQPPSQSQSHVELPSPSLSSYASVQSPYQQTPSSTLSGGQYPFPQALNHSPGHGFKPSPYAQQENHGGYGRSPPLPSTPLAMAPDNTHLYSHQPRQNSVHSLTTPTSAQSQISNFPKMSPQILQPQVRASSQSHATQQYHSQPGTPLGPPQPYGKPPANPQMEPSGPYEHLRSHSGSSYGYQQVVASSPRQDPSGSSAGSPRDYEPRRPQSNVHHISNNGDRERTLSVSPKTRLPVQPEGNPISAALQTTHAWNVQVTPAKRKLGEDSLVNHLPLERKAPIQSHPLGVNGILNAVNPTDRSDNISQPSPKRQNVVNIPPITKPEPNPSSESNGQQDSQEWSSAGPSAETQPGQPPSKLIPQDHQQSPPFQRGPRPLMPLNTALDSAPPTAPQKPAAQQVITSSAAGALTSAKPVQKLPKIKRRPTEIPIYAQSSRRDPALRHKLFSGGKPAISLKVEPGKPTTISSVALPHPVIPSMGKQEASGQDPPGNSNSLPRAQPIFTDDGPLGPWEPSIINMIPSEEIIRSISDYLFTEVVRRDDVSAGPAGGGPGKGAVLEIEAKLGKLIDKHTNERLRLPVMSECIINSRDPSLKIEFKSSMTEAQHRSLNKFLNSAVESSQTPKPQPGSIPPAGRPRIPMSYVHTYEKDSFFELSQSGTLSLPASIRAQLNPRHPKARVRVTNEQRTGKEIARIIKARVSDLDVYSPCTVFDWRLSVNIEMNFEGDLNKMAESPSIDGKRPARNKDRLSYKHLAYQIDLTQVTPSEATSKEHELEIEVSSAEIRKQGLLAKDGLPNDYEKLIRGFVDNVRLLARHCQ